MLLELSWWWWQCQILWVSWLQHMRKGMMLISTSKYVSYITCMYVCACVILELKGMVQEGHTVWIFCWFFTFSQYHFIFGKRTCFHAPSNFFASNYHSKGFGHSYDQDLAIVSDWHVDSQILKKNHFNLNSFNLNSLFSSCIFRHFPKHGYI